MSTDDLNRRAWERRHRANVYRGEGRGQSTHWTGSISAGNFSDEDFAVITRIGQQRIDVRSPGKMCEFIQLEDVGVRPSTSHCVMPLDEG